MASKHPVLGLVEQVHFALQSRWAVMQWHIVELSELLHTRFGLLLVDMLLPDLEHIYPAALVIRPREDILVVPVALAVEKTRHT